MKACPECEEVAIETGFLSLKENVHCSKCFARFEYKTAHKWFFSLLASVLASLSICLGLYFRSWFVLIIFAIIVPGIVELLFPVNKKLKLVGVKAALRERDTF